MLSNIEFFKSPSGEVLYRRQGESVRSLTESDRELIGEMLSLIRVRYPEAFNALSDIYSRSEPNRMWFEYRMVSRFVRCNLSDYDTQDIDIDENGMLHFEQMKCPLHGSGDCPWEGVVCKPKLDTGLSPREMELVPLFAEGLQSQVIADRLHIAKFTVDNHRRNILAKLGKHSVTELAAWYYDHVKPQQ